MPKRDGPRSSSATSKTYSRRTGESASDRMTDKCFVQLAGNIGDERQFSGSIAHQFCEAFAVPNVSYIFNSVNLNSLL